MCHKNKPYSNIFYVSLKCGSANVWSVRTDLSSFLKLVSLFQYMHSLATCLCSCMHPLHILQPHPVDDKCSTDGQTRPSIRWPIFSPKLTFRDFLAAVLFYPVEEEEKVDGISRRIFETGPNVKCFWKQQAKHLRLRPFITVEKKGPFVVREIRDKVICQYFLLLLTSLLLTALTRRFARAGFPPVCLCSREKSKNFFASSEA